MIFRTIAAVCILLLIGCKAVTRDPLGAGQVPFLIKTDRRFVRAACQEVSSGSILDDDQHALVSFALLPFELARIIEQCKSEVVAVTPGPDGGFVAHELNWDHHYIAVQPELLARDWPLYISVSGAYRGDFEFIIPADATAIVLKDACYRIAKNAPGKTQTTDDR